MRQLDQVWGETVVRHLVLAVKRINIYIILSQSHQGQEENISVQTPLPLDPQCLSQHLQELSHGPCDIVPLDALHHALEQLFTKRPLLLAHWP